MRNTFYNTCLLSIRSNVLGYNNRIGILKKAVLIIAIFLIGCQFNRPSNGDVFIVDYHRSEKVHFEDFFDLQNMSIISFGDDNPLLLTEKVQIEITEEYIFLFDKGYSQLYRFDRSGKLLNRIGRSGQGPAEYFNPGFFAIDVNRRSVDILCDNGSAIMTFDFDGDFLKKVSTPNIVLSFDRLNSNLYYYYTGYFNSLNFHRLHRADTTKILKSYLSLNTQAFELVEMNFTPMGDYGYFREPFFPSVYKYCSNGIEEIFTIDFGRCEITQQMLEKVVDPYVFFEKIANDGFCSTVLLISRNDVFYVVTIEQDNFATDVSHLYVNLADSLYKRVVSTSKLESENDFFSQLKPVYLDSEGRIYFLTNPLYFNAFVQPRHGFLQDFSLPTENVNPIIMVVPFKEI